MSSKFYMLIILLGIYRSVAGFMTLTLFQTHSCVTSIHCCYIALKKIMHIVTLCDFSVYLKRIMNMFFVGLMSRCVENMNIVFLELFPFISRSKTLNRFQGHSSVK